MEEGSQRPDLVGFEGEEETLSQGRQVVSSRFCSGASRKEHSLADTSMVAQSDSRLTPDFHNCKIINLCYVIQGKKEHIHE